MEQMISKGDHNSSFYLSPVFWLSAPEAVSFSSLQTYLVTTDARIVTQILYI